MATLHVMHGFMGVGKSTFSKKLEKEIKAIRFNNDEWMIRLFGANPPKEHYQDYYNRIEKLMMELAAKLLEVGQDVILDIGFWKRSSRDYIRGFAKEHGSEVKLYQITCPDEIALQRVLKRTEELPEGALEIDEHAYLELKKNFEPLQPDEEFIKVN
jgi:predicted kinase